MRELDAHDLSSSSGAVAPLSFVLQQRFDPFVNWDSRSWVIYHTTHVKVAAEYSSKAVARIFLLCKLYASLPPQTLDATLCAASAIVPLLRSPQFAYILIKLVETLQFLILSSLLSCYAIIAAKARRTRSYSRLGGCRGSSMDDASDKGDFCQLRVSLMDMISTHLIPSDYIDRYFFYRQKVFQCETTGKINLNFFEAMLSELQESNLIESQFPDALKGRVLKHVQFQTIGRMDHLVDHVYDRFRDVFYAKEEAICDLWGDRYKGIIMERRYSQTGTNPFPETSGREKIVARQSTGSLSPDGRWKYWYFLRITDPRLSRDKDVELRGDYLSRDRLLWSKALLKKYLREATTREPYIGAPWMIKPKPAKKYGLALELTPELQKQKEEHFASLGKKKRPADAPDGEVKKPKLIKYPIEDLELPSNEDMTRPTPSQDITVPQNCMESFLIVWNFLQVFGKPLGISPIVLDDFEGCLRHDVSDIECVMIAEIHAVLLNTIIKDRKSSKSANATGAMALAPALTKASKDGISSVDVDSSSALSVLSGDDDISMNGNGVDHDAKPNVSSEVVQRFVKVWDAKYLAANDEREGWENVLVGCLAALGAYETVPNLDGILQHLTANEDEDEVPKSKSKSRKVHSTGPSEQYPTLSIADKLQVLEFLVDLAGSSKAIKLYMEECELQLTELRKERIEVSRAKKRLIADREALDGGTVNEVKKEEGGAENGKSESLSSDPGSDDDMEIAGEDEAEDDDNYEDEDEDASGNGRGRTVSRQARLRKQQAERERAEKQRVEQLAAQRAAAREKTAGAKQIAAERRRLDEEEYRLQRKEDQIEREFRRHSCARSRPLGKDRFFNRYWWFDGIGAPLQGAGGAPLYGAGRLFIQGPTDIDSQQHPPEISLRREIEEGASGTLPNGHWAFFTDPEDVEQLKHWLNTKGQRELALTNVIRKYEQYIVAGMRKRNTELANLLTRPSEARRSSRAKTHNSSMSHEPYMSWTNKMIK